MMSIFLYRFSLLTAILLALAGCRPPAENDLYISRIYQAQGQAGKAYNFWKRYAKAVPEVQRDQKLVEISPAVTPLRASDGPLYAAVGPEIGREEIFQRYQEESRRKLEEYEDAYSQSSIREWDEAAPGPTSDIFPITVVIDRDVLAVALINLDDYLVLLEDVSIMYKDHLHYQNPYLMSGVMLGIRGFYQEAIVQFREAITLDPGNARAYNNLGITFFKLGDFALARDNLLQALKLEPDNIFARNNLGLVYLKLGEKDKAEEDFRRVLTRDPFNLAANFYLGFSYYQSGDWERAERVYREINIANPELAQVNFALGSVMVRLEEWDQAIDYFQKTLSLEGSYYQAYVSLGAVYNRKKMYSEAEESLLQAIDLEPDYGPAYYNLACIQAQRGEKSAAIASLKKAVEKGFVDREFILSDSDLEAIRAEPEFSALIRGL